MPDLSKDKEKEKISMKTRSIGLLRTLFWTV